MRYIFKILLFGDPKTTLPYVTNVFRENGEDKEAYNEWFSEIKVLENICDLEVVVISEALATDIDEIIPSVDGIIYFLNPLNNVEFEFFEMILPIIDSVKRDIPTIINFFDQNGILPLSTRSLLEHIWVNFPNLEAFINIPSKDFQQILHCLCLAMITGDTPLNLENAWMRFPLFLTMANEYYKQQNYYYSAQAMKKAAIIADINGKEDYFIFYEQAAFLYSKINLFLEASEMLRKVDKYKALNFKKLNAEVIILEGNKLFNKQKFELAAIQYENAAQWASIESMDKELIINSFKLAINSWISACKCQNAFNLLERLPRGEVISVLNDVSDKIIAASEFLISINNFESTRIHLYTAINRYQKEDLFEHITKFTLTLIKVLIKILEQQIIKKELYNAKKTFDEIENIWETYHIKKTTIDDLLKDLIKLFIEDLNFSMAALLINKLGSIEIKRKLTELISEVEEKKRESERKEFEVNIERGIDILNNFIEAEHEIINKLNCQQINISQELVKQGDYYNAANILEKQSNFLKNLGKKNTSYQILIKALDILIEGKLFEDFFALNSSLPVEMNKKYLAVNFPKYLEKLKEICSVESNFKKNEHILVFSNKIFRNCMLYDESKEIIKVFIKILKKEALKIIIEEENLEGINRVNELIKKINDASSSYLDNQTITFNKIYKKITEVYINFGDLSSANAYNDKIEKKAYKSEIYEKIAKIEAEKSALKSRETEESLKGELLKEKLSIIRKKAHDAFNDRDFELKQRRILKRAYFNEALNYLKDEKFDEAIKIYKDTIIQINRTKKYNLAGVSLALICLLLIKQKRNDEIDHIIIDIKEKLSSSGKLFSETFPVTLIEYIRDINKLQDEPKLMEALSFLENLPLFEEEIKLLHKYLGKEYQKEEVIVEKLERGLSPGDSAKYRSIINRIGKSITTQKSDIAKRRMMKRQYWERALINLSKNETLEASLIYLNAVPKLCKKDFFKHAAIGLILGVLILYKEKDIQTIKSTYEKNLKKLYNAKEKLEALPEIQLMEYLFIALINNDKILIKLCLEYLVDNLFFFEPEINYLKNLSEMEQIKEERREFPSREERRDLSKLRIQLNQTLGHLQQQTRDIKADALEFFAKRKAMKRRYYEETLKFLGKNSFDEASKKYLVLTRNIFNRKDFKTTSLLILLYGFSLLKYKRSPSSVRSDVNKFLASLGLSRQLISKTFYVMLLFFIIDVKLNQMNDYIPKIKRIFEILPLFQEEKVLIDIF